jgi:DNA-binding transcriptional MerR regulator
MAEATGTGERTSHLSIGEVLALLLEEFPEVTISKIRFLESQGLINPERTPSGYRKFYDDDIDLLKVILREQRENFLPLKVIKDRLDSGEIDPTSEHARPKGIKNVGEEPPPPPPPAPTIEQARLDHPAGGPPPAPASPPAPPPAPAVSEPLAPDPTDRFSLDELCESAGLTVTQVEELESYGLFARDGADYTADAVEIARHCTPLLAGGIDARHLKGWRVAAEREAGLYEQLIQPLLRQRNPEAHRLALADLGRLEAEGGQLRAALVRASLRHHAGH